jgi:hypothetical protein
MALGVLSPQARFEGPAGLLGERLRGIYRFLADYGGVLFPEDYPADLYKTSRFGQPTGPARVVATVMLLQSHEGLSDAEATDRLGADLRWQAAAGVHSGYEPFHPTLLVGVRNRLRASARPKRLSEDVKEAAKKAGVMKDRARVLDSTPVYGAVATQDTVTQLRAAVRKMLRLLEGSELGGKARSALGRDDDYCSAGKPPCDWDDPVAREELVDALVKDAKAALGALDGEGLGGAATAAAELLALVAGQDVEQRQDGTFVLVKKVAEDRVISTVDTEARHGHKSANRQFDGFKCHLSVDPDSGLIDEMAGTAGNAADREAVDELLAPVAELEEKPVVFGDSAYADGETLEHPARCSQLAPRAKPAGRSPSTATRGSSSATRRPSTPRSGNRPTRPPTPKWSQRSAISSASPGAGARPVREGWAGCSPTSSLAPLLSTSPASLSLASIGTAPSGPPGPDEGHYFSALSRVPLFPFVPEEGKKSLKVGTKEGGEREPGGKTVQERVERCLEVGWRPTRRAQRPLLHDYFRGLLGRELCHRAAEAAADHEHVRSARGHGGLVAEVVPGPGDDPDQRPGGGVDLGERAG